MSNINWSKWSAIAEIISSIAILVTLIFLVVETSQNSDLLEQNTTAILSNGRQNTLQSELDWLNKVHEYPEIYNGDPPEFNDGLNRETRIRRLVQASTLIRMRENSWMQYQLGAIDRAAWEAYMSSFKYIFESNPYLRWQWEFTVDHLDLGFVKYVNETISK